MELVLATLEVHEDGKIGIICATDEMFQQSGAGREDVEGFINYPRSLSSVQVAAFIKKTEGDIVSVSLRAKGKVDVALIASGFGGGGHKNAAGFRFTDKTVDEVQATVLAAVKDALQT
jgi:phosphoesterase RecJ-like protein